MSSVTVEYMRSAISDVYPSREWRERVDKMPNDQIIAIYHSFLETGRFEKGPTKKPKYEPKTNDKDADYGVQLTIYDFLKGEV